MSDVAAMVMPIVLWMVALLPKAAARTLAKIHESVKFSWESGAVPGGLQHAMHRVLAVRHANGGLVPTHLAFPYPTRYRYTRETRGIGKRFLEHRQHSATSVRTCLQQVRSPADEEPTSED